MNFINYARGIVVFFGMVFIIVGLFFLQYWDERVLIGLIMLITAPMLLIASFFKINGNKMDEEKNGAPF